MKISIRRAAAAVAAGAMVASGVTALTASANAQGQSSSTSRAATVVSTPFGYNTVAQAARIQVQGTNINSAALGLVTQACTRQAGLVKTAQVLPETPVSDYIDVDATKSVSRTYKEGTKYGAFSSNTIGHIEIGNLAEGLGLFSLHGLTTTADAFHTPQGYNAKPGLKFADISLTLPDALKDVPVPVQDLLDAINQTTQPVVTEVLGVLQQYGTIAIPGFGSIGITSTNVRKGAHFASAEARGLVINFTGDGSRSHVILGKSYSRIGGVAPAHVFRSNIEAMDVKVLDGALHLGRVGATNLPCEGTFGVTKHKKMDLAGIITPLLIDVKGIDHSYNGIQNKDKIVGWVQSSIGSVSIPLADLTLKGIVSRVKVSKYGDKRVVSSISTSVAEIIIGGESVAVPKPGQVLQLPNGIGTIETGAIARDPSGARATALKISIFEQNVEILLGVVSNHVSTK